MKKNKSKPLALLGAALILSTWSQAQSIAPQSVNSGGTKMSQANGSLSFTVGELLVLTQIDNQGNTLNGGFTAGATLNTVSVKEPDSDILNVNVYPNPTSDLVNIQIKHSSIEQVMISITDLQGKEIYNGTYAAVTNTIGINTVNYASGTYVLSIKDKNKNVLGTYNIIKQ